MCKKIMPGRTNERARLQGPFAGKPWVKNVLRTLTSIRWSIA